MKKLIYVFILLSGFFLLTITGSGQVGIGTNSPASSSIIDLTNTRASGGTGAPLLWPTNPNPAANITSPVLGEEVYNTTSGCFNFYNGSVWVNMGCPCLLPPATPTITAGCSQAFQGSSVIYTSSITTGVTYNWTVTATTGTPIVSGNGTSSITVMWPNTGANSGTVNLMLTNLCGTSAATQSVTINATPTISSNSPININSSNNIYTVSQAGAAYSWSFISNNTGSTIAGSTTGQSVNVTAGSTGGTFTLRCIVTIGSCSQTVTSTTTVSACGSIALDVSASSGQASNTVSITTSGANEIVIIHTGAVSHIPTNFTPSVSYTGPSSGSATQVGAPAAGYYTSSSWNEWAAVFAFVAPTAGTYNITVTETGAQTGNGWYWNFASAYTGFCSTPTVAANVTAVTAVTANSDGSSILPTGLTATVTTSVANSAIATVFSSFVVSCPPSSFSWTGATGLQTIFSTGANCATDGALGYTSAPTTTNYTIRCQEVNSGYPSNTYNGVLYPVIIHL